MASYDHDKVVKMLKANKDLKQSEVAQKLGVTVGQVPMLSFCKAQVEAGVYAKAPATEASVKKLRNEGNRWELIAARTGLSIAQVKAHAESAGILDSYTGRGRNFAGGSTTGRKSGTKTKAAGKKATSKNKTAGKAASKKSATSGRPSARKATSARPSARPSARGAGRRSSASNPS